MSGLSETTQRLVAIGLLVLAILLALTLIVLPLWSSANEALEQLEEGRFRLQRLRAIEAQPHPVMGPRVASDLVLVAKDRAAAEQELDRRLAQIAQSAGVASTDRSMLRSGQARPDQVVIRLSAQGPEPRMLDFMHRLETGRPIIRFRSWALNGAGANIALSAEVVAAWGRPE